MYSMHYIDRFIKNFREFYNEINGATLTGAIDVVVVEQPDGSFTCSPFHVRFGKLGVLRSNFKVVDLELNGEPLQIHMKLGESGEAFFVEEVGEDEAECSAHLATSPIPAARFEERYEPRRRNSLSVVEPDHGQASDYTKRRYTADGQTMQKPDITKLKKNTSNVEQSNNDHDALFEMEGLDETAPDWTDGRPKTFAAAQLGEAGSEAHQTVQKISAHNDFRPIDAAPVNQDEKTNGNGKKKKKTRKVSSKKKHQRKSSTSSISSQSDRAGSEQRSAQNASLQTATDLNFFSDGELASATLSDEMSNMNLNGEHRIPLALSDTAFEVHAGGVARNASMYVTGGSRSGTPVQSDTEVELARAGACGGDKSSQSWRWGELPEPPPRGDGMPTSSDPTSPIESPAPASPAEPASPTEPLSSDEERPSGRGVLSGMFRLISKDNAPTQGVYLDDLDKGAVDPNLYLSTYHTDRYRTGPSTNINVSSGPTEEEYESGNGPSLPQSPASLEPQIDSDDDDKILAKGQVGVYVREEMVTRAVPFEEFCRHGGALAADGRLVVRLGDRWLPWRSAGPLLLSLLAYRRRLPNRVLEDLEKGNVTDKEGPQPQQRASENGSKPRGYSWWGWRRSNADTVKRSEPQTKSESLDSALPPTLTEKATELHTTQVGHTPTAETTDAVDDKDDNVFEDDVNVLTTEVVDGDDVPDIVIDNKHSREQERQDISSSESENDTGRPKRRFSSFRKTLRLSSEQIKNLNLREGMNEMVFSVTTAYQGTTRCKCNVFRWRHDDKIVISDIDGTITKSDVLGHIFPLVGKDWAQSGVAQLFTKIKNNGYQLLYLSARAIGQARVTREYLRSIKQGELSLPDGPLLLNPTSLLRAFHREVIEKKPEEFKISCLADIKALFPPGSNPFYAGYGNRVNDVCAYQAVGIPIVRIFTINYKGELKHELTQTFQSTYSHMSVMVDQVFPPAQCEPSDEFSQTVYWREPLPAVELPPPAARAPPPAAKSKH